MSTTVRVSLDTHRKLAGLARESGLTMQQLVEQALESYRRQHLLDATNAAYERLRADRQAWTEVEAERREWDATLADGLETW